METINRYKPRWTVLSAVFEIWLGLPQAVNVHSKKRCQCNEKIKAELDNFTESQGVKSGKGRIVQKERSGAKPLLAECGRNPNDKEFHPHLFATPKKKNNLFSILHLIFLWSVLRNFMLSLLSNLEC